VGKWYLKVLDSNKIDSNLEPEALDEVYKTNLSDFRHCSDYQSDSENEKKIESYLTKYNTLQIKVDK